MVSAVLTLICLTFACGVESQLPGLENWRSQPNLYLSDTGKQFPGVNGVASQFPYEKKVCDPIGLDPPSSLSIFFFP